MSVNALATLLILLSAVLHAAVNALVKTSDDGLLTRGCMNAMAFIVSLPFIAVVPAPSAEVWLILLASMLVHWFYPFFLVGAYRAGDLSAMMPLARGISPLGVAVLALIFAGEQLSVMRLASIGLVCLGVAMLAFERTALAAPRGVAYAVATGLIIACYTVLDGIGLRKAATPTIYIAWLFMLDGLFVGATVGWLRRDRLTPFLRRYWRQSLWGGVLGISSYGLALYALSMSAMAAIAALRETSVIFAAAIGALVLGEPFGRRRIIAACIVAAGVILLQMAR
ncbi:MAG TPA: DMT family transporter [Burkholderiales bacterium]|nr:DMT family transporter [Burkholderiales bacterium]